MNTSRIFWGTLWIVAGLLILLAKLDVLTLEVGSLWKFWPLVLVIWGISVLTGGKVVRAVLAAVSAVLLAVIIYGVWEEWASGREPRELTTQTFMETYDTAYRHASLHFSSGAGTFTIRDTCSDLFRAETGTDLGKYEMHSEAGDTWNHLTLGMEDHMTRFGGWRKNSVAMRLHPGPIWALTLEVGAAKLDADLSPFAADRVEIKTGAADVNVRLGKRAEESRVLIQAGVSSVTIRVPESAGCEISSESGLTSKKFDGFRERGDGVFRTANFDTAGSRIFLSFKAGVSSLRVVRY